MIRIKQDGRVKKLSEEIEASSKLLIALGDESRQHVILTMMSMGDCSGVRAVDIAERTSLSRPPSRIISSY
jgi:ArsR family transcriptional regulator